MNEVTHRDPTTPDEWQAAVDAAEFCLIFDSSRAHSLTACRPIMRMIRCKEILERGRARDIVPRPDAIERGMAEFLEHQQ